MKPLSADELRTIRERCTEEVQWNNGWLDRAHDAVPRLCDEVERLRAGLTELRAKLDELLSLGLRAPDPAESH